MLYKLYLIDSDMNNADGFATGSVLIQDNGGLLFPGPDNQKSYGTEKPGIACSSGSCGSQIFGTSGAYSGASSLSDGQSNIFASGCSTPNCGNSEYSVGGDKLGDSFAASGSSTGSGIDLGPLSHFFGIKGANVGNAGSYSSSGASASSGSISSSGSFANAGSFASSKLDMMHIEIYVTIKTFFLFII